MQSLADRPLGRFGRPRPRLWPAWCSCCARWPGSGLACCCPGSHRRHGGQHPGDDALVAVGFGVLGLVTVIFSLLFLVVQWAFSSLSPRLNLFRDDPIVWRTFGFAIGVFVFSVTTALVIGDQQKVSVIVPAAEVVAVLAAIAFIRSLQVKAFASIQLAPTLSHRRAGPRGHRRLAPGDTQPGGNRLPAAAAAGGVLWPHRQAILQQLDLARLLRAAAAP